MTLDSVCVRQQRDGRLPRSPPVLCLPNLAPHWLARPRSCPLPSTRSGLWRRADASVLPVRAPARVAPVSLLDRSGDDRPIGQRRASLSLTRECVDPSSSKAALIPSTPRNPNTRTAVTTIARGLGPRYWYPAATRRVLATRRFWQGRHSSGRCRFAPRALEDAAVSRPQPRSA
jgi:hypothetical protein